VIAPSSVSARRAQTWPSCARERAAACEVAAACARDNADRRAPGAGVALCACGKWGG
jgi:hypothetical protein